MTEAEIAAAAAAAQAQADKAAADKALADKAAADKVIADKAAADQAAADAAASTMTTKERELLHEVMEKKNKLKTTEAEKVALAAQLKAFDGIDPVKVRELLAAQAAAETKELEKKGEYEQVKKQIIDAATAEKKTLADQVAELSKQLKAKDATIDTLSIGSSFAGSKFIGEKLTLSPTKARALYGPHFELNEAGTVVAFTKPAGEAGRAPLVGSNGDPLSFDAALEKLIDLDPDKDTLLRSTIRQGANSDTRNGGGGRQVDNTGVSGVSRIAAGLKAGGLSKTQPLKLK